MKTETFETMTSEQMRAYIKKRYKKGYISYEQYKFAMLHIQSEQDIDNR